MTKDRRLTMRSERCDSHNSQGKKNRLAFNLHRMGLEMSDEMSRLAREEPEDGRDRLVKYKEVLQHPIEASKLTRPEPGEQISAQWHRLPLFQSLRFYNAKLAQLRPKWGYLGME